MGFYIHIPIYMYVFVCVYYYLYISGRLAPGGARSIPKPYSYLVYFNVSKRIYRRIIAGKKKYREIFS